MVNSYYNEQDWSPQHAGTGNHQDNWTPPSNVKMPYDVTKNQYCTCYVYNWKIINKSISFKHKKFTLLNDGIIIQFVVNLVYFNTWIQIMFMLMLIANSVGAQSFYFRLTRLLVKIINNNKKITIIFTLSNHDFIFCGAGLVRAQNPLSRWLISGRSLWLGVLAIAKPNYISF